MSHDQAAPELSRRLAIERIGHGMDVVVEASGNECAALAERMGIPAVLTLTCRFALRKSRIHGGEVAAVEATGTLSSRVVQSCVVSLEPVEATVEDAFTLRFIPEGIERDDLGLDEEDEIPYQGDAIDLGEAAAQQLALALDPFPRKPGAELEIPKESTLQNPFAALAQLKKNG